MQTIPPEIPQYDEYGRPSLQSQIPKKYETVLNPSEEQQFQLWKKQYAPNDSGEDYDLRGAYKAGLKPEQNGHWPDTYKKPNHPTFSNQSVYAKDSPNLAGSWNGEQYIPPNSQSYRNMQLASQGQLVQPIIAPQVQQPAQQQPDFSPINISPAPATATEKAIQGMQLPNREDPAFKNNRLRTVLNAIAGGFAGAAGGPKVGLEVGRGLRDEKYNRAMEGYTNKLNLLKQKEETEKGQFGRTEKGIEEGIKRGTGQSLAETRQVTANINARKADTTAKDVDSKVQARADLAKNREDKLNQLPPEIRGAEWFKKLDEDSQQSFADFELARHPQKPVPTDAEKEATAQAVRTGQLKAEAQLGPGVAGAKTTAVETAKRGAPLSEDQLQAVENAIQRSKANPDAMNDVVKSLDRKSQTRFWATYDGPAPRKLNTEEQKIATTAKTAIGHATNLLGYLKDLDIQASIGPIKGRISQLEQAIGSSFGKTGNQENNVAGKINSLDLSKGLNMNDPKELKVAKFLDLLKYLVLFEASATSGTRPSWQLIKELKETQGPKFNIDRMMGNLEAAAESAGIRINALYQPSSSGRPLQNEKSTGKYKYEVIK